jgi:hypothetical protein
MVLDKYYFSDGTTSSEHTRPKVLHREDGPAVEYANGARAWYLNGIKHRKDGPAIVHSDESKHWYISGKLHREDGPAVEYLDGHRYWYVAGKLHREDGPAIEYTDPLEGDLWPIHWYMNGVLLSSLTKQQLIKYMELNNLTPAHLLTDSDEIVRTSAAKYDWRKL